MTDFNRFRPKRSAKRWLVGAPECVIACYDNRGKTADRYTVLFGGSLWTPDYARLNAECGRNPRLVPCLGMSGYPTHPQGISMWGEALRGPHLGKKIPWNELLSHIRAHVIIRASED